MRTSARTRKTRARTRAHKFTSVVVLKTDDSVATTTTGVFLWLFTRFFPNKKRILKTKAIIIKFVVKCVYIQDL